MPVTPRILDDPINIAKKTAAILARAARFLERFESGTPVLFTERAKHSPEKYLGFLPGPVFRTSGPARTRPTLFEQALRKMPKSTHRRFFPKAGEKVLSPTKIQFTEFERELFKTLRRIINREFKRAMNKMPRASGRPQRRRELIETTVNAVKSFKQEGKSLTRAADKAAKLLNCNPRTVWRHLAIAQKRRH